MDIMLTAWKKYPAPEMTPQELFDTLRHWASQEGISRISAKFTLWQLSSALDFEDGINAVGRVGMPNYSVELPTRKGKVTERITAAHAAKFLGLSRATFFRKAKCPRFRESLGYSATNERNGRYSLDLVLDAALQQSPAFRSRSLRP